MALYFVFKPYTKKEFIPIAIEDINLNCGQSTQIKYQLRVDNATVEFSVTDESIAKISTDNNVEGVSEGVTYLKAEVIAKSLSYSAIAQIRVLEDGSNSEDDNPNQPPVELHQLQIEILPIHNCEYVTAKISMKNNIACFSVELYSSSSKEEQLQYNRYQIVCSEGVSVEREFNWFLIKATKDGGFFIYFEEYNYAIYIEVYV